MKMVVGILAALVGIMQLVWLRRFEDDNGKMLMQMLGLTEIVCGIIGVMAFI